MTRRLITGCCIMLGMMVLLAGPAPAVNSVVVESKSIQGGSGNVEIGIFLTNDRPIQSVVIPLVLRSLSGNAFITKLAVKRTTGARIGTFMTGAEVHEGFLTEDILRGCFVPLRDTVFFRGFSRTPAWMDDTSHSIAATPVAALIFCVAFPAAQDLPAGADNSTPSFHLLVDVGNSTGTFDIDTVCVGRNNHVIFVADSVRPPKADTMVAILPTFTKGVISVVPTAVEYLGGDDIPREYSLDQNYPNPFNASTVIRFNIKRDGNVRLDVYNILGQKVKTLINEFRRYGPQAVSWDGTDMDGRTVATGLYFYRLAADDYVNVRKMLLVK